MLPMPKIWFKIIHAEIAATTPSSDITIAAGAAEIFLWPNSCNAKAAPPDNIPAYKISNVSRDILEKSISSKITTSIKDKSETIKFWIKAIEKGKLNL